MFVSILEKAIWSDAFFNFEPAMIAFNASNSDADDLTKEGNPKLFGAAFRFLMDNPKCPADGDWLIEDFLKRI